jgi:hypothetical protein
MNKFYKSAGDAMKAAYELSQRLGRRVWRHQITDSNGATRWYVSLEQTPTNALQGLAAG